MSEYTGTVKAGVLPQMKKNGDRYLIVIDTNGNVREISLDAFGKTRLLMGQLTDRNDIVIPARIISRSHGKFKLDGFQVYYADLGSSNGTILEADGYQRFLKGNKKYYELKNGNILRIQPENPNEKNSVLILYLDGKEEGTWRRFPLLASRATIGRDDENDIVISGHLRRSITRQLQ
ncbi:MAG: FHA domain-containing protein [Clostridiales bacterium]|nr:FHA domain-containing protein [Clostridiales bacterium]